MQFRLDQEVNALYIEFREGEVAKTIELAETVYMDVDGQGSALGLEFVNAADFLPFLREHVGGRNVPAPLRELLGASIEG